MNEAKILACPFCGSEAKLTTTTCDLTIDHRHTVICSPGCGASGQVATSPELALEAWNKRAGGRQPEAVQNAGDIAGSFQRMVSLLADGIKAAEGAQVIVEAYYEDDYRDPANSDQYCKLMDWLKDARRQVEQANDKVSHSRE